MKDANRAFMVGYYGMQNAGDDAFLAVTAWGARQYLGCREVFTSAPALPATYNVPVQNRYPPVSIPGYNRLRQYLGIPAFVRLRKHLAREKNTHIIFGGGSNFHSTALLSDYCALLDAADSGMHFAIGVSIGPFRDATAEAVCARLLQKLAFVGVRDQVSYQRAVALAPSSRVEVTFDIAPLLSLVTNTGPSDQQVGRRGLGVAICDYERFVGGDLDREAQRVQIIAEAIRHAFVAGVIQEVVLLDFNSHPYYGDHALNRQLFALLDGKVPITHFAYDGDPAALFSRIRTLRGLIAMRLHAAVFAFCVETPFLMLSYHEKCRQWAELVGLPVEMRFDTSSLSIDGLIDGIKQLMQEDTPRVPLPPELALKRALRNWEWLNEGERSPIA